MILKVDINVKGDEVCFIDSIQGKLEKKITKSGCRQHQDLHTVCLDVCMYLYKHVYITRNGVNKLDIVYKRQSTIVHEQCLSITYKIQQQCHAVI